MDLGEVLRQARTTSGMTLRKVEKETGVSNGYLSQLESGSVKNPSPKHLLKLARAYGIDYGELMRLAGYVPPEPTLFSSAPARRWMSLRGIEDLTDDEQGEVQRYIQLLLAARNSKRPR